MKKSIVMGKPKEQECLHCGTKFIPAKKGTQKFCSHSCRSVTNRAEKKIKIKNEEQESKLEKMIRELQNNIKELEKKNEELNYKCHNLNNLIELNIKKDISATQQRILLKERLVDKRLEELEFITTKVYDELIGFARSDAFARKLEIKSIINSMRKNK
jgi:DNA-binding protein YbaB